MITLFVAGFGPTMPGSFLLEQCLALESAGGPGNGDKEEVDKTALVRFPLAMLGESLCKIKLLMYFHSQQCVGK